MVKLAIDIETFSSVDLKDSGVYPYVDSPDFEILLFAYAFDDEPVQIMDLAAWTWFGSSAHGFNMPPLPLSDKIVRALTDPNIIKTAFNANFERICLSKHLGVELPIEQWECTMVHALMLGLPGSLEKVAEVLKLEQQKMAGKQLINYFSKPCNPTKVNNGRIRNYPDHNPEKWETFKDYCRQDVEVERAVKNKLSFYKIPEFEKKLWYLDQKINDRGIRVDADMVRHALACDAYFKEKHTDMAKELTNLENPNSVSQLKKWVGEQTGQSVDKLDKNAVRDLLETTDNPDVEEALLLRGELSKASVSKYKAISRVLCADGRIRGQLQYYGANRTGRWGGRHAQIHNLPKNFIPDLDLARETLLSGDYEMLSLLYDSVPDILSQLVRTALIASQGNRFIIADFSAIEARILAWLADEKWVLDVFKGHGKIYEATAAQMFKVPFESVTKGSPLRQKGKIAVLALGYNGGPVALINQNALKSGLTEEELPVIVKKWRDANPNIVKYWKTVERAALKAVREKKAVKIQHGITFIYEKGILFIQLPSGRRLSYLNVKIEKGSKFNNDVLTYGGVNQNSKQWKREETYGGKLVENITQAVARDCLAEALINVHEAGYDIAFHVHDEVVIDAPYKNGDIEEINQIMSRPIAWAPGLPLTADAYQTVIYRKD